MTFSRLPVVQQGYNRGVWRNVLACAGLVALLALPGCSLFGASAPNSTSQASLPAWTYTVPKSIVSKQSVAVDDKPYCWTQAATGVESELKTSAKRPVDLFCRNTLPVPITMKIEMKETLAVTQTPNLGNPAGLHVLEPLQIRPVARFAVESQAWRIRYNSFPFIGKTIEQTQFAGHTLPFPSGTSFGISQSPDGVITSHKGVENAIDFSVPVGTTVTASKEGYVAFVRDGSREYGRTDAFRGKENIVLIHHDSGEITVYAHLDAEVAVVTGQRVSQGDVIGKVGLSGMLGGPHLHYEIQTRQQADVRVLPVEFTVRGAPFALRYAGRYTVP